MKSVLIDVFEITGRGCVVLIEPSRDLKITVGAKLVIGDKPYEVIGVEMVSYNAEGLSKLEQGWKPPLGLVLGGASKADLVEHMGDEVVAYMDEEG